MSQNHQAPQKIKLSDAMNTLKSMFGNIDEQVIKTILYQTNGHMEATVEILLQMQADDAATGGAPLDGGADDIPHNLPDDFLVLPDDRPAVQQRQFQHQEYTRHVDRDAELAKQLQRQMIMEMNLEEAGIVPPGTFRHDPQRLAQLERQVQQQRQRQLEQQGDEKPLADKLQGVADAAKKKLRQLQMKLSKRGAPGREDEYTAINTTDTSDDFAQGIGGDARSAQLRGRTTGGGRSAAYGDSYYEDDEDEDGRYSSDSSRGSSPSISPTNAATPRRTGGTRNNLHED